VAEVGAKGLRRPFPALTLDLDLAQHLQITECPFRRGASARGADPDPGNRRSP
jgi:hypothetical protein